jgi:tRNA(fMet)-specific endonuclease VapC
MASPVYMLDSSVCVPILRGKSSIKDLPLPVETEVSSIVAAELWAGVYKLGQAHRQFASLTDFFEIFVVIEFLVEAARHYGEIRAELEGKGMSIGPLDLLIAAHARSLGATLITANVGEFKRVKGLKVLAWK